MDLEEIKVLQAIDEFGSINAAAENLFMAKSAISTSIKQAETNFGFKLLDRSGYRAKLSAKAKMYLEKAQRLLKASDELESYRKLLSNNIESSIKISSTLLYKLEDFIALIKKTNKKFPSTSIFMEREVMSGEKMLLNETVDLAITEGKVDTINLEHKKIASVKMPLVISAGHKFIQDLGCKRTLEELQKYPQIILRSTFPDTSSSGGVYHYAPKWNVSDNFTKLELIYQGLGWGRMPEYLIEKDLACGKLVKLNQIEKTLTLNIYLARRKNYSYAEVAKFIWSAIG